MSTPTKHNDRLSETEKQESCFLDLITEKISLWTKLTREKRNIVIYGMGDGAEKIMAVLLKRGIYVSEVFASDDFVRGQSFKGYTVKRLNDIEAKYDDFIILTAFASKLPEIMERIKSLSLCHELYIPDVNVFGDALEVFDEEYLMKNTARLERVYSMLADDNSRSFFVAYINYKLSGKLEYLDALDEHSRLPDTVSEAKDKVRTYCDLGAYTGDTVREYRSMFPSIDSIVAFEPEKHSYKKLKELFEARDGENRPILPVGRVTLINGAAGAGNGTFEFEEGRGRGSVSSTVASSIHLAVASSRRGRSVSTDIYTVDSVLTSRGYSADIIKYDVEGCEHEALSGSRDTINASHPMLFVSCYHKNEDLFLPAFIEDCVFSGYTYYVRRSKRCFPAWEIEYIACFVQDAQKMS